MSRRRHRRPAAVARDTTRGVGVSLIRYQGDELVEKPVADVAVLHAERAAPGVKWVNVDGVHDRELVAAVGGCFGLHPLVLEDIVHTHQRAKLEDHGSYLFACIKMLYLDEAGEVQGEQLSIVLGRDFVLTFQEEEREGDVFGGIRERLRSPGSHIRRATCGHLFHAIVDAVVDEYFAILEKHEEEISDIEGTLGDDGESGPLHEIQRLKRKTIMLRRSIWPVRELVGHLERAEPALVSKDLAPYIRDLYDHAVRLIEMAESSRDLLGTMHDLSLSLVSNRLNRVMKVLTIISTIFIPLTFLAGVYGMNFQHMPELAWRWGYPVLLGVMGTVAAIMLLIFRRNQWF